MKTRSPRISVVIPTYNRASLLCRTLDSVLAQTRPADEIIVVDDGSTDDTRQVVENTYIRSGVEYIYQENAYLGAARNTGQQKATGDFLIFLDSDDLLLKDALERLEKALLQFPKSVLAYGRTQTIDQNDIITEACWDIADAEGDVWQRLVEGNFIRTAGCVLIRREAIEAIGIWDCSVRGNEDWDMWICLAEGGPVTRLPEPVLQYRVHGGSMSSNEIRMQWTALAMFAKHKARHTNNPQRLQIVAKRYDNLRDGLAWRIFEGLADKTLAKGNPVEQRKLLSQALQIAPPRLWIDFLRVRLGAKRRRLRGA